MPVWRAMQIRLRMKGGYEGACNAYFLCWRNKRFIIGDVGIRPEDRHTQKERMYKYEF